MYTKEVGINETRFLSHLKSYLLSTLLLLSLSLNQGLGMMSSASAMATMQNFSDKDTLAICTGTRVKWISALEYYASGDIVEVEAPLTTPDDLHEVSCVLAQFSEPGKDDKFHVLSAQLSAAVASISVASKHLFVSGDYVNHFNARAPPTFL